MSVHVLLLLPVGGRSAGVLRAGSSRHFLALRPPALVNRDYDPRVLVIVAVQATSSAAVGQSGTCATCSPQTTSALPSTVHDGAKPR